MKRVAILIILITSMHALGQPSKTATVTYLSASGYCVETENVLIIFDYPSQIDDTLQAHIISRIEEFDRERKRIIIVYTHELTYPFYDPLRKWNTVHNLLLFGWLFAGSHDSVGIPESDSLALPGITIYGHKALQGGRSILLKLGDVAIYHSGNNTLLSLKEQTEFDSQLQFIRSHCGEIDIAFIPVNHFENNKSKNNLAVAGALRLMDALPARNFFAMSPMQKSLSAFDALIKRLEITQRIYPVTVPASIGQAYTVQLK